MEVIIFLTAFVCYHYIFYHSVAMYLSKVTTLRQLFHSKIPPGLGEYIPILDLKLIIIEHISFCNPPTLYERPLKT